MKARWFRHIVVGLAVLAAPLGVAEANPWSEGITAAQKATAQSALEEGQRGDLACTPGETAASCATDC
ncbi:MAG: hypothetical protein H0X17_16135 [Deltaproteobacteria bacterium]|nr:hypothetical protein [Deltaproteobacteria bacterium]